MQPRQLTAVTTNRPDHIYTTADIEGSQPHAKNLAHRPRNTDPQNPEYRLASHTIEPPPVAALLRDTLCVSDIAGACPAPRQCSKSPADLSFYIDDIEGAAPGWRPPYQVHVPTLCLHSTLKRSSQGVNVS